LEINVNEAAPSGTRSREANLSLHRPGFPSDRRVREGCPRPDLV